MEIWHPLHHLISSSGKKIKQIKASNNVQAILPSCHEKHFRFNSLPEAMEQHTVVTAQGFTAYLTCQLSS
jgi:hypothetical protein